MDNRTINERYAGIGMSLIQTEDAGNHKLICGDSTDIAVIDRLMDGVKADGIKRTD